MVVGLGERGVGGLQVGWIVESRDGTRVEGGKGDGKGGLEFYVIGSGGVGGGKGSDKVG